MKTIHQIIDYLAERGITLTKMAEVAGVSITTLSRLRSGKYADIDYLPGKKLELLEAQTRRRKPR